MMQDACEWYHHTFIVQIFSQNQIEITHKKPWDLGPKFFLGMVLGIMEG